MAGVCKKPKSVVSNPERQEFFNNYKCYVFSHQVDSKNFMMEFQGMGHKWINEEAITTSVTDFCS